MAQAGNDILLRTEQLTKFFKVKNRQVVHAVNKVDLELRTGETVALVGESGCGKSTLARTMIRLLPADGGHIFFKGREITRLRESELRPIRKDMQMVFQDPYASLNPRMDVRSIIAEPLTTHHICRNKEETTEKVLSLMERVGVPGEFLNRYPHQFSGGQRQRIGIARAIALDPELLVCDEPVSALDVSVQSQILNLLKKLQKEMALTTLFIGHDLSVINFIADRVVVMFLGAVCESAEKEELYRNPKHPYTRFLLDAIPSSDPHLRSRERSVIKGEIPSPVNLPEGCFFHTRCPYATDRCREEIPEMRDFGGGHMAACHCL